MKKLPKCHATYFGPPRSRHLATPEQAFIEWVLRLITTSGERVFLDVLAIQHIFVHFQSLFRRRLPVVEEHLSVSSFSDRILGRSLHEYRLKRRAQLSRIFRIKVYSRISA